MPQIRRNPLECVSKIAAHCLEIIRKQTTDYYGSRRELSHEIRLFAPLAFICSFFPCVRVCVRVLSSRFYEMRMKFTRLIRFVCSLWRAAHDKRQATGS